MPFVKLDCDILKSTIWFNRNERDVFLTALLMAEPFEVRDPMPQLEVDSLDETAFVVPPGWYGFVPSAGVGIIHQAQVARDDGMVALRHLGNPEADSRSQEWDGRRLVRVNGGFIVLNFMKYRERDYTAAERQARYRERLRQQRNVMPGNGETITSPRNITQAEAEAEVQAEIEAHVPVDAPDGFDAFWASYPKKVGKGDARKVWHTLKPSPARQEQIRHAVAHQRTCTQWLKDGGQFIPNPATWLRQGRWDDEPDTDIPSLTAKTLQTMQVGKGFTSGMTFEGQARLHD